MHGQTHPLLITARTAGPPLHDQSKPHAGYERDVADEHRMFGKEREWCPVWPGAIKMGSWICDEGEGLTVSQISPKNAPFGKRTKSFFAQ